jgi:CubicO group peptidase (beta-lactamase class C family)
MSELDRLAEDIVGRQNLPGVAVAVVHADQVIASAAAGLADPATGTPMSAGGACNWFSMTKIATATALLCLALTAFGTRLLGRPTICQSGTAR